MHLRKLAGYVMALGVTVGTLGVLAQAPRPETPSRERDLLYAAVPGGPGGYDIGVGVLVFDVNDGFSFVKRIPTWDYPASQVPELVKGIEASVPHHLMYIATAKRLLALDLTTDKLAWHETYDGQCCDQMAVSPDNKVLYQPADLGLQWYVIDAATGKLIKTIPTPESKGSHNTIFSPDGSRVYLAGYKSPIMSVADPKTHAIVQTLKFGDNVRPLTINGSGTLIYAEVDNLLGFEIMDLKTGQIIQRVEVPGFGWTPKSRNGPHGNPSHGIALTPDEKEVWVADGVYEVPARVRQHGDATQIQDEHQDEKGCQLDQRWP